MSILPKLAWLAVLIVAVPAWAGPICSWNMDEGSGQSISDSSGNGFVATFTADSGNGWVAGVSGKAVHLGGGSGCIEAAGLLDNGLPEGTISFWAKFDRLGVEEVLINKLNDETNNSEDWIRVIKRRDNRIELKAVMGGYGANMASLSEVAVGEWTNITVTWGPNGKRLYIDGALEAEDTYNVSFGPGKLTPFTIGKGVSAAFDKITVSDVAEAIKPLGNQVAVTLVKAACQPGYRQGDTASVDFYFKSAKVQKGRAKVVIALYKNDHTVIRNVLSFSVAGWKPGEVKRIGAVKFDLSDAPQGNNSVKISGLATTLVGVPANGIVGNIKVKGRR